MNAAREHIVRSGIGYRRALKLCLAFILALASGSTAFGQEAGKDEVKAYEELDPIGFRGPNPASRFEDIKIQQNLGMQVPLDLMFRDEKDQPVRLADLFTGEPVILSLVYYGCPMLCTLVLNGVVAGVDGQPEEFQLGRDYKIITVSIDPNERGELASEKQGNYAGMLNNPEAAQHWRFLTGDKDQIEALAETVGFRYFYDEPTKQYAHDSGIMILTPTGKVSSYYTGIEYLPQNLRTALEVAGVETIGEYLKRPSLLCYMYDPNSGTYGFAIMSAIKIGGAGTVLALAAFIVVNLAMERSARKFSIGTSDQTPASAGLSGSA